MSDSSAYELLEFNSTGPHGSPTTAIDLLGDSLLEPLPAPLPPADLPLSALILEDDEAQRFLLHQHLDSLNFVIKSAATLEEARGHLASEQFDLGIFDVQVPDGSGLDLCAEIDLDSRHLGLPIVVLSSSNSSSMIRETRAAGGCFFLSKPYDPNVLFTIIERAIGQALD
ncbi:MAG: response regulator [Aureliella sp.]